MSTKRKTGREEKLNGSDHKGARGWGGNISLNDGKMSLSFAEASLRRREAGESQEKKGRRG